MRTGKSVVLLLLPLWGCAGSKANVKSDQAAVSAPSKPGPITKQDWCTRLEQFKDSPDWQCTWPPGRFNAGDFGPMASLGRYNISGAVFDEGDPVIQKKLTVRKIGNIELDLSKTVQISAAVGFKLQDLSPWLPDVTLTADGNSSLNIGFGLEDAEWRFFQNLPPTIADTLSDQTGDANKQKKLERAKSSLCLDSTALVEGVLVGRLTATIKEASGGAGSAHLGWSRLAVDVKAQATEGKAIVVKSTADPVAILYLVNPSRQMLSEFNLCTAAAAAAAAPAK